MINVAHGISFFIDLGLSGWPHEPGRAANRPLGCLWFIWNQLAARVKGGGRVFIAASSEDGEAVPDQLKGAKNDSGEKISFEQNFEIPSRYQPLQPADFDDIYNFVID